MNGFGSPQYHLRRTFRPDAPRHPGAPGCDETSVTELAEPFAISLPAITKHLKVLERAGLVTRGREAQWRPCRINADRLKDVADWVEDYRAFWEQRLDRLDVYLQELRTKEKKNGRKKK